MLAWASHLNTVHNYVGYIVVVDGGGSSYVITIYFWHYFNRETCMLGGWKRLHFRKTELKVIAKSAHRAHGSINHDLLGIMIPGGGRDVGGVGRKEKKKSGNNSFPWICLLFALAGLSLIRLFHSLLNSSRVIPMKLNVHSRKNRIYWKWVLEDKWAFCFFCHRRKWNMNVIHRYPVKLISRY